MSASLLCIKLICIGCVLVCDVMLCCDVCWVGLLECYFYMVYIMFIALWVCCVLTSCMVVVYDY